MSSYFKKGTIPNKFTRHSDLLILVPYRFQILFEMGISSHIIDMESRILNSGKQAGLKNKKKKRAFTSYVKLDVFHFFGTIIVVGVGFFLAFVALAYEHVKRKEVTSVRHSSPVTIAY